MPDKVQYVEGKTVDITGMVVTATFEDGSTKTVIEEKDGWGKITSPEGWISDQYYEEIS